MKKKDIQRRKIILSNFLLYGAFTVLACVATYGLALATHDGSVLAAGHLLVAGLYAVVWLSYWLRGDNIFNRN